MDNEFLQILELVDVIETQMKQDKAAAARAESEAQALAQAQSAGTGAGAEQKSALTPLQILEAENRAAVEKRKRLAAAAAVRSAHTQRLGAHLWALLLPATPMPSASTPTSTSASAPAPAANEKEASGNAPPPSSASAPSASAPATASSASAAAPALNPLGKLFAAFVCRFHTLYHATCQALASLETTSPPPTSTPASPSASATSTSTSASVSGAAPQQPLPSISLTAPELSDANGSAVLRAACEDIRWFGAALNVLVVSILGGSSGRPKPLLRAVANTIDKALFECVCGPASALPSAASLSLFALVASTSPSAPLPSHFTAQSVLRAGSLSVAYVRALRLRDAAFDARLNLFQSIHLSTLGLSKQLYSKPAPPSAASPSVSAPSTTAAAAASSSASAPPLITTSSDTASASLSSSVSSLPSADSTPSSATASASAQSVVTSPSRPITPTPSLDSSELTPSASASASSASASALSASHHSRTGSMNLTDLITPTARSGSIAEGSVAGSAGAGGGLFGTEFGGEEPNATPHFHFGAVSGSTSASAATSGAASEHKHTRRLDAIEEHSALATTSASAPASVSTPSTPSTSSASASSAANSTTSTSTSTHQADGGDDVSGDPYAPAIRLFRSVAALRLPSAKLEAVVGVAHAICACVDKLHGKSNFVMYVFKKERER
jgi:hypothetical protein